MIPVESWSDARERLPDCWKAAIASEFDEPYMLDLAAFLAREREREEGREVFPVSNLIFAALRLTPLSQVKAVILGQDPYHGVGQAMGLSFSVPMGIEIPPSLANIHKELAADENLPEPTHGCLIAWAVQGVLLLNTSLTVEKGKAGSHARIGWRKFTDKVIEAVNKKKSPVAFILWGKHAEKKAGMVDETRHLVHRSAHPSPLASYRGFFGSCPFSKANNFLQSKGINDVIDWRL